MSKKKTAPKSTTRIEMMRLDDALAMAHRKNPKEHDVPALMSSFRRFGFVAAPTIDESTDTMVAGHGRCLALRAMRELDATSRVAGVTVDEDGTWWLPVVRGIRFSSERERDAYVIADNQHTIKGGWNLDALTELLGSIEEVGFSGLGFDGTELATFGFKTSDEIFAQVTAEQPTIPVPPPKLGQRQLEEDPIPAAPKKTITKDGDVWNLGDSVLICGDCSTMDPARLRLGKIGFGMTSPPYNAGKNVERAVHGQAGAESRYQESDDMDPDAYAELLDASTRLLLSSCGVAAINLQSLAANKRVIARWVARFANNLVDRAVWVKTTAQPAINRNVFNSKFEDVYIFSSSPKPKRTIDTAEFHGTVHNVHEGASAARDNDHADVHGATMPVHLAQWAIEKLGARADFVVDPFGGTGTTLIVAVQLEKRCALVERDRSYCDIIVERWQQLTGKPATR